MSALRLLIKTTMILNSAFLITSCMTSSKQEQLESRINQLQDQVNQLSTSHSKSDLASKNELDDLKNQIQLTQGNVDELNNRLKKIEQSSGSSTSLTSTTTTPVNSEATPTSENMESNDTLKRQAARMQLANDAHAHSNRTGKLPANIKNAAEAEKALKSEYANGNFKRVEQISTSILNAKNATDSMLATALEYRGEAKFQQHNYKGAAMDLSSFIEKYPSSRRYPRALLLAGDSFVYLKKNDAAMSYYEECAKRYSTHAEGKAAAKRLESLKAQSNNSEETESPQS